jgi:hypothetical protein
LSGWCVGIYPSPAAARRPLPQGERQKALILFIQQRPHKGERRFFMLVQDENIRIASPLVGEADAQRRVRGKRDNR